jgi:uncharacterized protein (TIGR02594 family)
MTMIRPTLRLNNCRKEVAYLKKLLNAKLVPSPKFLGNFNFGPNTDLAVRRFQKAVGLPVTGIVDFCTWEKLEKVDKVIWNAKGATQQLLPGEFAMTPWIPIARKEIGVKELPSLDKNNPRILEYIRTFKYLGDINYTANKKSTGYKMGDVDETPWCACFVNWCLIRARKTRGPSARAKDWLKYGTKLKEPRFGCIAVVYHQPTKSNTHTTSSGYHLAFYISGTINLKTGAASNLRLLGGNQANQVSERNYGNYWKVCGLRWPT